ncbi:pPIWI_RE module domain-containing protein [Nonomuraea sp. NPDC050227]|uniref:pPIWI_RE module domain-containing protein n=1 Tax=Nonomuraea sp. NPDC050227 TaxID=3364360 RepID=UPI00379DB62B
MPVNYDSIRTSSWQPVSPDNGVIGRYRALRFPENWRDAILALCNLGRPEGAELYHTVPTHRFEQVLQAFAPDLLVLPRPSEHWLYVPEEVMTPLPDPVFRALLDRWLGDLRPEPGHRAFLKDVRAELAASPPRWERVEAELLRCPTTPAGSTAAPLAHQFPLSTDWLARRVLALGPYEHGAGRLHFRAVPRGPRDKGAELVSQPLPALSGTRNWWYSVVLNITLHTVPFDPLPRFHLHFGIRRWATRVSSATGRVHLPYRRKTTVLLRPRVPYLPGAPLSERYALAKVERRWDREQGEWVTGWVNGGPTGILRGISLAEPFPRADDILSRPEEWLDQGLRAGIVYSTAMGGHQVKAGLMSHQRSELTEWAEQALPPEVRATSAMVRTRRVRSARPLNAPPTGVKKDNKPEEDARRAGERRVCAAFAMSLLTPETDPGTLPTLEARLLWQTRELREAAVKALVEHLGLKGEGGVFTEAQYEAASPGDPVTLEWQSAELTVRLRCVKLTAGLGEGLALPPKGKPRTSSAIGAAVRDRRTSARSWMADDITGAAPTLALVELDRRADFETGDHDPKFALRLGFADAGAVTQFVTVPKKAGRYDSVKTLDHRVSMAWDDGLRQLGIRVHPEHGLGEKLPVGLRYAAIWLVRKNRTARNRWAAYVPIAVLVTPQQSGSGIARVQGWDPEANAWIPYPALLLKLTRLAEITVPGTENGEKGSYRRAMDNQRRDTEEWLQKMLRSLRGAPTLLLTHGQNARSHWTWLQDGHVEPDRIRDGHAPARRLHPNLRLVRVRTVQGRETPQWWGVNPKDEANGLPSHLWVPPCDGESRIFYSTTPKPAQFRTSAIEADKLAPRRTGEDQGSARIDTNIPGWNPGLVEIAVLGCHQDDGDDPESLALAVHQLRQPPDYPQALALPLPLHLAGLGQEYVLPTLAEEVEDEACAVEDLQPSDAGVIPVGDGTADPAMAAGLFTEPDPEEDQPASSPDV